MNVWQMNRIGACRHVFSALTYGDEAQALGLREFSNAQMRLVRKDSELSHPAKHRNASPAFWDFHIAQVSNAASIDSGFAL